MRGFSIREWAAEDQPGKKLRNKGASLLSNAELLAILMHNGTRNCSALDLARTLLETNQHDLQKLATLSVTEMVNQKISGLGEAKATRIVAALELGIRRNASQLTRKKITRSSDVAEHFRALLEFRKQEVFAVVFLNRGNRINHWEIISEGGLTGTVADPRVILKKALDNHATGIILFHNHPSGNLQPSNADEALTQKIKQAAALLDINVMDHIIVSQEGYYSFADEGRM